jgi:hypothetical protein
MRDNIRPELIEDAIGRYYRERPVQLSPEQVAERTEAIEKLVGVSQQAVMQVRLAKSERVVNLKAQQSRLLRLHLEEGDDVSPDAFRDERQRLQAEIAAAEKSLAATEEQLSLDATVLRLALELAEDVAEVYRSGDESLKRGYNQAFFKKLYVMPERDEDTGQPVARIANVELTEPYAVLLADELVPGVLAEAEAIARASENSEGSPEGLPAGAVSNFESLAGLMRRYSNPDLRRRLDRLNLC